MIRIDYQDERIPVIVTDMSPGDCFVDDENHLFLIIKDLNGYKKPDSAYDYPHVCVICLNTGILGIFSESRRAFKVDIRVIVNL